MTEKTPEEEAETDYYAEAIYHNTTKKELAIARERITELEGMLRAERNARFDNDAPF